MLATAFPSTEYPFDLLHSEMVNLIFAKVDSNDRVSFQFFVISFFDFIRQFFLPIVRFSLVLI